MSNVVLFTPKAELTARENIGGFIDVCRNHLTIFGDDLDFDALQWDVTEAVQLRGHGRKRVRITFCTLETVESAEPVPLPEPLSSLAKAYVRYAHGLTPSKTPGLRVAVFRALAVALEESVGATSPERIDGRVLNRAAQIIKERYSAGAAYRLGSQLEMLVRFMVSNNLLATPIQWKSFLQRPIDTDRVGEEFDKRRAAKMPSLTALKAIAHAYTVAVEPMDVVTSVFAALALSSPDRANEILHLRADCKVNETYKDGSPTTGLRWFGSKGAGSEVKHVAEAMVECAEDALSKVRALTDEARRIAAWYEANPSRLYIPDRLGHFRGVNLLSLKDVGHLLVGEGASKAAGALFVRQQKLPVVYEGKQPFVRFEDFELAVVRMLPDDFPFLSAEIGLRYSEALFVVRKNELHNQRGTYVCMIDPVTTNQINTGLGCRVEHGFESIFTRLGFAEDDGSPIRITSHQFRHYLNTIAILGGASDVARAIWASRKDMRQNAAYDHVTPDEMVQKLRATVGTETGIIGPLATMPTKLPISRDEFSRLKIPTAHKTALGFCLHDYSTTPCELHQDCINCREHVCIKGDAERTAMLQRRLNETNAMLLASDDAKERGALLGEDRVTLHLRRTNARLRELCAILENPSVPEGSLIQLSNITSASRIAQADEARRLSTGERSDSEMGDMALRLLRLQSAMETKS